MAMEEIIDQLKGIRGPDVSFSDGGVVFSLPDADCQNFGKTY